MTLGDNNIIAINFYNDQRKLKKLIPVFSKGFCGELEDAIEIQRPIHDELEIILDMTFLKLSNKSNTDAVKHSAYLFLISPGNSQVGLGTRFLIYKTANSHPFCVMLLCRSWNYRHALAPCILTHPASEISSTCYLLREPTLPALRRSPTLHFHFLHLSRHVILS